MLNFLFRLVRLFDCRYETVVKSWDALGEVEKVLWNSFDTNYCLVNIWNILFLSEIEFTLYWLKLF